MQIKIPMYLTMPTKWLLSFICAVITANKINSPIPNESRNFSAEQTALESRVDGFDLHVLAVLTFINLAHHIAQMRLPAVFPCGIFTRNAERAAEAFGEQPDPPDEQLLAAPTRIVDCGDVDVLQGDVNYCFNNPYSLVQENIEICSTIIFCII